MVMQCQHTIVNPQRKLDAASYRVTAHDVLNLLVDYSY